MNPPLKLPINENFHLRQTVPEDAEETFALIDKNLESLHQDPDASPEFVLVYKDRIVGRLGIHRIDLANRSTSIGYWLDEDHQRKGIMTVAVKAVSDYIFDTLQLNRIELRAGVKNQPSRAIAERLGFQYEGTARKAEWIYDHFIDLAVYALLKKDHPKSC